MKKYIFVLIASVMATASLAQTMTPQEEREFYQKAYEVINQYAQAASIDNERNEDLFLSLFENTDIQIYNDLMSLSYAPTLSVEEYAKTLRAARSGKVTVKNVTKGEITDNGDTWTLPIMLEKSVSYVNSCGSFFDSFDYFKKNYKLIAILTLEKATGSCYISSLKVNGDHLEFPREYTVLVKHDDRDAKLDINNRVITFNRYDQVLLHPNYKIKYLGSEIEEEEVDGTCDRKIYAKYNDRAFRIRPNFGFSLTDFNKMSGASDFTTSQTAEMSFGLDIGYVFPSKGRLQTGVFVGVGMSTNNLTMELVPSNGGTFESGAKNYDEDGDTYQRVYQVGEKGITQELKATDIVIPVYIDLEYRVAPDLSIYGDLGVKVQMTSGETTGTIDNYATWGRYPQYNNLIIGKDGDVTLNGFGNHASSSINIDETGLTKSMAIDGLVGLGLRLNIGKAMAIDAGIQYQTGTKSWKNDTKSNDIAHYTAEGEQFYSIIRRTDGINHGALRATASLIFKF